VGWDSGRFETNDRVLERLGMLFLPFPSILIDKRSDFIFAFACFPDLRRKARHSIQISLELHKPVYI
jgi:hypothetical protein